MKLINVKIEMIPSMLRRQPRQKRIYGVCLEDNVALPLPTNTHVMIIIHIYMGLLYFSRKPKDIDNDCLKGSGGYTTGPPLCFVSYPPFGKG